MASDSGSLRRQLAIRLPGCAFGHTRIKRRLYAAILPPGTLARTVPRFVADRLRASARHHASDGTSFPDWMVWC